MHKKIFREDVFESDINSLDIDEEEKESESEEEYCYVVSRVKKTDGATVKIVGKELSESEIMKLVLALDEKYNELRE